MTTKEVTSASATAVFAPIIKALLEVEAFVHGLEGQGWIPADNWEQHAFLERFYAHRHELEAFGPEELKAWARRTAEELNNILAAHGYDIRLRPWQESVGSFGVVAIMDALAKWMAPGECLDITCRVDGKKYPGVKLTQHAYMVRSSAHPEPLLGIQADGQYEVWMTVADEPLSGLDLVSRIQDIRDGLLAGMTPVHGHFPMINLDQETDIRWMQGLRATGMASGRPVTIAQALQQTRFRMNEFGAHAQSAVAMAMSRGFGPPSIDIDRPFYLWMVKDLGANGPKLDKVPVFAAYLSMDCWENPGSIE